MTEEQTPNDLQTVRFELPAYYFHILMLVLEFVGSFVNTDYSDYAKRLIKILALQTGTNVSFHEPELPVTPICTSEDVKRKRWPWSL